MSAIEVRHARRRFGVLEALSDVSLSIEAGRLFGLVGPDGAGKTTLIRLVAGLLDATSGEVRVLGLSPTGDPALRQRLGLMPQEYSLYGDLSIDENLSFFGDIFGLSRRQFAERRERLLAITRLAPFVDRRASALSGGMYKKLALSCALLHEPEVLLLDEPTNGVDPVSRRELWDLVYTFVDQGMTVLVSTPYMDEAARCHRTALLSAGRILTEGAPDELLAAMQHVPSVVTGVPVSQAYAKLVGETDVIVSSPTGDGLRIIIEPGAQESVEARVRHMGGELRSVTPIFEDVFLTQLAEARRDARESASSGEDAA